MTAVAGKSVEDVTIPVMDEVYSQWGRWLYPIGPAPKGWHRIENCSRVIPHDEYDEDWQNDEMNSQHIW